VIQSFKYETVYVPRQGSVSRIKDCESNFRRKSSIND